MALDHNTLWLGKDLLDLAIPGFFFLVGAGFLFKYATRK